jgi:ectoine hydroxylase-related dioxygenase (phytanoyl-CoA dioxygenase family)
MCIVETRHCCSDAEACQNNGAVFPELHSFYALDESAVSFFRENGYVRVKNVFSAELLEHYHRAIGSAVERLNTQTLPLEQRSLYDRAFLQIKNIWTQDETVREFVFSRRLGQLAADLLEVSGVRLYHDQALYKEPGGGFTPWHADQYYWPLATDRCVTAWVPLQETPLEMGPLSFCPRSQHLTRGRDLEIGERSELTLKNYLADYGIDEQPFALGEVSFHLGWTFHRAGANQTERPREVMTVIYMDENMRLAQPRHRDQELDWKTWCPGVVPGEVIASPINPVIYSRAG